MAATAIVLITLCIRGRGTNGPWQVHAPHFQPASVCAQSMRIIFKPVEQSSAGVWPKELIETEGAKATTV